MSAEFTGTYRAIVVRNEDPQKAGRVTLRIPQILGNAESAWAVPSVPVQQVPNAGDLLFVTFESGDVAHPIYHANSGDTGALPKPPTTLSLVPSLYVSPEGITMARISASWVEPTENQDGSVPISLSGYYVSYSYDNDEWSGDVFASSPSLVIENISTGQTVYVRVTSISAQGGHLSPYVVGNVTTDASPANAPAGSLIGKILDIANGKNRVHYDTSPPDGTDVNVAGDVWFVLSLTSGDVLSQWEGQGGTGPNKYLWVSRQLDSDAIANLSVGKLVSGSLAVGTVVTVGDPNGQHTELSGTGLSVYTVNTNPDSPATTALAGFLGVEGQDDFLQLGSADGTPNVTLNGSGDISAKGTISVDGDGNVDDLGFPTGIVFGGNELGSLFQQAALGTTAVVFRSASLSFGPIVGEVGLYEFSFLATAFRNYSVHIAPMAAINPTASDSTLLLRLRYTDDGSTPSITSAPVHTLHVPIPTTNQYVSSPPLYVPADSWAGSQDSALIRLLLTAERYYGSGSITITNTAADVRAPYRADIIDAGPDIADTFVESRGGGSFSGGTVSTGNSYVKRTYITTWSADGSHTFRGAGAGYGEYTLNDAYTGSSARMLAGWYSSSNGNQYDYIQFKGLATSGTEKGETISSALLANPGGPTPVVTKVELWVHNESWYSSAGGSQRAGMTSYGSLPGSGTAPATTGGYTTASGWTPNSGKWIPLPSGAAGAVQGGGRVAILGPGSSNSNSTYGKFTNHAASSNKPLLRLTYVK